MAEDDNKKPGISKMMIFNIVIGLFTIYAIYLSYSCNNGFDLVGLIGACCCGPLYVIYKLLVECNKVQQYYPGMYVPRYY